MNPRVKLRERIKRTVRLHLLNESSVEATMDGIMGVIDAFVQESECPFKIGDTVKVVELNDTDSKGSSPPCGSRGIVVGFSKGNHEGMVLVEFESKDWVGGHNGMKDCVDENGEDLTKPTSNGWYKDPSTLEKI